MDLPRASLFVSCLVFVAIRVAAASPVTRIVNGTATTIEQVPFQVSILYQNSQYCGGAILNSRSVLTAAHCFDRLDAPDPLATWTIRTGSSRWSSGGRVIQLKSVHRHEDYNSGTFDFDITVVRLASPVVYGVGVQPVMLAGTGSTLSANEMVQVSGWGRLSHGGLIPDVLQSILLPVLSRTECTNMFADINPITSQMFCAGYTRQGQGDSCNGDSGGPLVNRHNMLFGVVSWGLECATEGFTGVYTNVPLFIDWIRRYA